MNDKDFADAREVLALESEGFRAYEIYTKSGGIDFVVAKSLADLKAYPEFDEVIGYTNWGYVTKRV
tara:strand:+ start:82 stop:279 length:198 start_codon:yes stop_codon:yes gene_type:complete